MSPSVHRKRTLILVSTIIAIVFLVIFIVVLWVLQGSGAFHRSSEKRRSNSTLPEGTDRQDDGEDVSRKWVYGGTHNDSDLSISSEHHYANNNNNNPNVQFVTPFKISPQPLHHHDLIYDQMHNETTAGTAHHSGHFRHKTAEVWDPHPEYEIWAFGKKLHLNLELNDDIPKNIHITHIYGNYSRRIEHDPRTSGCYYRGTIKGDANSSVSVNLCHGMTGHIYTSTGNYYIAPVENSTEDQLLTTLKHKIIKETYKTDDNSNSENNNISHCEEKIVIDDDFLPYPDASHERTKRDVVLFDDVDNFDDDADDFGENFENRRSARGISGRGRKSAVRTKRTDHEYFIEVLVVADKSMVIYHKNRESLIQYILILMSHVGILFKDATVGNPITLVVVHISILNNTEFTHSRSDQMLKGFCEWQRDHNNHIHHDAAILLTRNFICKNVTSGVCHTLGIAEVGGMCSESSSCAIVKDNGLSSSYTIAHEMGHLLNMRHDDYHQCTKYNGGSKSNIMSKMLHNDTKPWQWSACSRHYLTEFLDSPRAYCLLGKPKDTKLEFTNTLPGENFEVNRQCELEFGVGSKICSFMGTCSSLWCTSETGVEDNGCRTQHMPWADGTMCDHRSWCHHGKCIKVDRRSLAPRNGIWGPWQSWGSCSRTCGGGIKIRKRECNQPPPANGGSYCTGQSTTYASCNIQQCPTGTHDFREDQCAEFDGYTKGIAGLTNEVKWVPKYGITDQQDLCRLFCRVKGTNEYYRLKDKVVDGTKCSINSFDICVNGRCLPGGCDNTLNSTLVLDECGVCNGDNSTCQEVLGRYNTSTRGYTRVVRIPKGSSNIVIEQQSYRILDAGIGDDNYLSLVDGETGEYVLNGNFVTSSFKRDLVYGGLTISYSGSHSQIERLTTPKNRKLTKDLVLEVLAATGMPPDIRYRYTINKEMAPKYGWQLYEGNWTECNSICRGIQYTRPVCLDLVNYTQVHGSKCSDLSMEGLIREKQCNMYCKLAWNVTKSGFCSVHCGHGWQEVNFNCVKIDLTVPNGAQYAVDDMHCSNLPRSASTEPCKGPCDATHWQYSPWSQCSTTCGNGIETRTAKCVDDRNNTIDDSHCHSKKKFVRHACNLKRCPMWTYEDWTSCSTPCGKGYRSRKYYCSISGQVVNNDMCNPKDLKIPKEECEMMSCQWYIGNWTLCSVSCGDGIKIREVECRAGPRKVHANLCRDLLRPVNKTYCTESPCEIFEVTRYTTKHDNDIPNDMYYNSYYNNYKWEMGRWSECSRSCQGGTRSRQVVCRDRFGREDQLQCDNGEKPVEFSRCNEFECPAWRTGEWSKCNAFCQRSRRVGCFDHTHAMAHPLMCNQTLKPEENLQCKREECYRTRTTSPPRSKPQQPSDENKKYQRYRWKKTGWTPCSNSCGKGTRTRKVSCRDTLGNVTVVDGYCQGQPKPKQMRFCQHYNKHNCTFTWVDGPWSKCSKSCGEGLRYRNVTCQRVFPGGIIQEGVISNWQKCDPYMKPATSERCQERMCNDPYMWKADTWSKCSETCGTKGSLQMRRLHCTNQRGQKLPKKWCRKVRRPERKRRCPTVHCNSCREIQRQMKTRENKEHILNLHGKLAPIHCYKMDTDQPEEYISLQGSKENYVQYYDYRVGKVSQTNFWKIRLNTTNMKLIQNDTTFSESNSTRTNYGQAGTNDSNLNRYVYFVIDMSDTTFRLADSVRWVCTEADGRLNVDVQNDGQVVRGVCAPNCGVCVPDPHYGLPVEIT